MSTMGRTLKYIVVIDIAVSANVLHQDVTSKVGGGCVASRRQRGIALLARPMVVKLDPNGHQRDPIKLVKLSRDWGTEVFLVETPHYLFKRLDMNAGTKGGLQYHVEKVESFYLQSGEAIVRSDDGTGQLIEERMYPGQVYHVPAGAPHQVEAVTDCVFFEASTPHYDDRVRVETDYGLPEGTGLPTTR